MIKLSNLLNRKHKTLLVLLVVVLVFGIVTPVLAAYLGPLNRTSESTKVETYDYGVWAKDDPGYPSNPICSHKGGAQIALSALGITSPGIPAAMLNIGINSAQNQRSSPQPLICRPPRSTARFKPVH